MHYLERNPAYVPYFDVSRPIDWKEIFPRQAPLEVEIGAGLGEYLVRCAREQPQRNFVGIELDWKRVKRILRKVHGWKAAGGVPFTDNVRVLQVEATVAFERLFVPGSIDGITCLFPCPWPKKKHWKFRLFSAPFLRLLNSRLVSGGVLTIVTDHLLYYEWIIEQCGAPGETGFAIERQVISPRFRTKYERKWCSEGQTEFYSLRLSKETHQDVPLQEDVGLKAYFSGHFDPDRFQFKEIKGKTSVLVKEFLYDPRREKAMLRVVVAEPSITQQVWLVIVKTRRGWCIAKAEGHTVLPTRGVAAAIYLAFRAARASRVS